MYARARARTPTLRHVTSRHVTYCQTTPRHAYVTYRSALSQRRLERLVTDAIIRCAYGDKRLVAGWRGGRGETLVKSIKLRPQIQRCQLAFFYLNITSFIKTLICRASSK